MSRSYTVPLDPQNLHPSVDSTTHARTESSPGVHALALLTTVATFPLICMGGLVTSHHAGMSVPDWPNSYGYNMFLFPPSQWVGGILYEHTHRLMGTVVGMCAMALAAWAWRGQIRNLVARFLPVTSAPFTPEPHRYLALAVLGGVIFQGVLGGLRVVWVKLDLAIVHACVAQAFFCLAAYAAIVTSPSWTLNGVSEVGGSRRNDWLPFSRLRLRSLVENGSAKPQAAQPAAAKQPLAPSISAPLRSLMWLAVMTVTAVYLQLIVGAIMRHFDAGLAIPDLPLAYGKLLPPTTPDALNAANHLRTRPPLNLDPVTLPQIWLHFGHRIGAVMVSVLAIAFAIKALFSRRRRLVIPAVILLALLTAQVTLGVLTVLLRKPADVASAHVAVGALVLVTSFVMMVRVVRLLRPSAVLPEATLAVNLTPSPLYTG
jgi:cytochrome c oxidase assembly protein subunit 15